ncbi:MAG: SRPBCC domain-containing protein [Gammaproteobacteria bacterium]|jgi:uncharacterized protein YndB with AHSA1/START domain|nr:SRPBCC domain-containing protein [Gammaproteobacteria bacterium]MBT3860618.1 SRPBCC domain-containing protein [Gammaproteobacteria bacterium]MBT3988755.1 SRPBCC domain-containing protein [Gammaproteobacteria bacterium]MBT4255611.1 SRPBCC domain-containing protein [Gammaproteobacteria bacterium]MBT4582618.1 SRPBCC domain-containing protein [Gammaproteobacteria bacterium]
MQNNQMSMFELDGQEKAEKPKQMSLSVSRTISAPAEKVYDHWLIPTFVGKWMFAAGNKGEHLIDLHNEVRPRGEFSYKVQRGGKDITYSGAYQRIDRPRQLIFSWKASNGEACPNRVTVDFEQLDQKTKLKISMQMDKDLANFSDEVKQQWSNRSKALATLLSK